MRYGSRIKEWITDHDIKQKALAKEFHITESMMSHYMTGRNEITVDLLVKFAQKYGLSTDYLVGLSDSPRLPRRFPPQKKNWCWIFAPSPGISGS